MSSIDKRVLNKKVEIIFELLVKNFNQMVNDDKQIIRDVEGFNFAIHIKPRVVSKNVTFVGIYFSYKMVTFSRNRKFQKFVRFSVGIVDKNGNIVNRSSSPFLTMSSPGITQEWYHFSDRNHMLNPESGLLRENTLMLWCNIEITDEKPAIFSDSHSMAHTFEKCYKSLLDDNEMSDFTIVVNEKEFSVHRSILAARSPVFRAMITTDMKEKRESRVVLHDIDEDVAQQLLYFIYTGRAPKIKEMAHKLSIAADFFDMPDLKLFCAQTLFGELSESNVMEALRFGETYGIRELVLNAIDYIGDNREKVRSKVIQRT